MLRGLKIMFWISICLNFSVTKFTMIYDASWSWKWWLQPKEKLKCDSLHDGNIDGFFICFARPVDEVRYWELLTMKTISWNSHFELKGSILKLTEAKQQGWSEQKQILWNIGMVFLLSWLGSSQFEPRQDILLLSG